MCVDALGNIHIVWTNFRNDSAKVYYKTKNLMGWQPHERLTNDSLSRKPCVAVDTQGDVDVVWADKRNGHWEVYCKEKATHLWSLDTCLTEDEFDSSVPNVVADPFGNVHLTWFETRDGNPEIYYKEKTTLGWSGDFNVTQDRCVQDWPSAAVDGLGNLHLAWMHDPVDLWYVFYRMRDSLGVWSDAMQLSDHVPAGCYKAENASIAADKHGGVHVVWNECCWDSAWPYHWANIRYREKRAPIGVEEIEAPSPLFHRAFRLFQNQPNPFSHSTFIPCSLPQVSEVTLTIYGITGRLVETLLNETQQPGIHQVRWNRKDNPSGVYFYTLRAGERVETRKMVVIE